MLYGPFDNRIFLTFLTKHLNYLLNFKNKNKFLKFIFVSFKKIIEIENYLNENSTIS